ncbi:GDSL esterase/lipase At3g27950-like [Impatiens glandulifera]|uniref:GDSL esterase/lipase At3g27950-like n=1 Tax=Impatiens glandulifera TaxID=253017 RepID=UPI001FB10252|nr:GDSL esterase/lipase At3g27950-like [Impatiens glandulifera]
MPMRITDAEEGLLKKAGPSSKSFRIVVIWVVTIGLGLAISTFVSLKLLKEFRTIQPNSRCQFPAIFNFGDSNSDTGSESAAFGRLPLPFGQTFFGKPSGRRSDGRLIIDFMAQRLRIPYLSAYLDSIGSNFRHGANFAYSGSTVMEMVCMNQPLHLVTQVREFQQFKQRIAELHNQGMNLYLRNFLPRTQDFSKALYMIDSGQNDLYYGLTSKPVKQVKAYIPSIIDQLALVIQTLYQEGARTFWIHNTGPIGCLPIMVKNNPPRHRNADKNGCIVSYNKVAKDFNIQLHDKISRLRTQMQDALIVYVDMYSAKYSIIDQAKKLGLRDGLEPCCGPLKEGNIRGKEIQNGTCCSNPNEYINWDNTHYTEAANNWVANFIINGSYSEPPVALTEAACTKPIQETKIIIRSSTSTRNEDGNLGSYFKQRWRRILN